MANRKRPAPKWLSAARQANRTGGDWLSRALGRAGILPASEVESAIAEGRVRLDGRVATSGFAPVTADSLVSVDGRPVSLAVSTRVLMFHKPSGAVASGNTGDIRPTVDSLLLSLLPPDLTRYVWHAVGRLDVDTTGLLLFTNDERFVAFATSPQSHLPKSYLAEVNPAAVDTQLEPLRAGIELHDGPARPAKAQMRRPGLVELTLTEGRNHQVKRMLGQVGLPVLKLHREAVGKLTVDIPEGQFRELSEDEVAQKLGYRRP